MIDDFVVEFANQQFTCVDHGFAKNEQVDIVIRPEDLELTTVERGKLRVRVDSVLFRGVHYELCCYDTHGNEWLVHSTKRRTSGKKLAFILNQKRSML